MGKPIHKPEKIVQMRITVLGATGLVGQQLVTEALARNFEVTVLVRTPDKVNALPASVNVVLGDYFDPQALAIAVEGSSAVLSTIGPPTTRNSPLKPEDFHQAMMGLITVLESKGITRFIHLASTGTRFKNEPINFKRKLLRMTLSLVAPRVIPSKELELNALVQSSLDWTSIRPPLIDNDVKGDFHADSAVTQGWRVNTRQLCTFMLDQMASRKWIRKAPFVGTR